MRNRVCGAIVSMTKKSKKRGTLNYMSGVIYLYKAGLRSDFLPGCSSSLFISCQFLSHSNAAAALG